MTLKMLITLPFDCSWKIHHEEIIYFISRLATCFKVYLSLNNTTVRKRIKWYTWSQKISLKVPPSVLISMSCKLQGANNMASTNHPSQGLRVSQKISRDTNTSMQCSLIISFDFRAPALSIFLHRLLWLISPSLTPLFWVS